MPGAASPEEAVFTGADDPTASPVAQEFIKKLQAQGLPPTAANMRRLVEANARGTSQAGPDLVEGVRNDVVENSARPAARRGRVVDSGLMEPQGPLPTPPIPPGTPTAKAPVPVVDPESGQVVSPEGGDFNANIGALIAGAVPLLYGLSRVPGINRMFPGGGPNVSGVTLNPTPGALPAPPPVAPPQIAAPQARLPAPGPENTMVVRPPTGAPPTTSAPPPQIAAPQAQLPAPQARLPAPQQALPAPPTNALPPGANAPPSVIRMPSPPAPPVSGTTPTPKALLDILSKQRGMRFGAGIPFMMESPQDIISRWKK